MKKTVTRHETLYMSRVTRHASRSSTLSLYPTAGSVIRIAGMEGFCSIFFLSCAI